MEKITNKWKPILDAANIKSNEETISLFCENVSKKHAQMMMLSNTPGEVGNTLPLTIKLLSTLNLVDKDVALSENVVDTVLDYEIDYVDGEDRDSFMNRLDNNILKVCKNYIDEKLDNKKTLVLEYGIKSISIISEAGNKPKGSVRLSVDFQ